MAQESAMAAADLWFDPICPWAWVVSRWLTEATRVRDVQIRPHVMSLAVLNESPSRLTSGDATSAAAGQDSEWAPVRVMAATQSLVGDQAVLDLYSELGPLIHHERMPIGRDIFAFALGRAGLPHSLANAAGDPFYDSLVRASHRIGAGPLGEIAACPIICVAGPDGTPTGFVGPLVTPYPRGESAGRLWDAVALAAATDGFFSLRRLITRGPDLT
jgi:hypothetical protein